MKVDIPGRETVEIKNLLLDFNGTIALDGVLIPEVAERIKAVHDKGIEVHLLTADTHGTARTQCADIPLSVRIFDNSSAAENKKSIAESLGWESCMCIGNGFNDRLMFETCSISVAVMGDEGCSVKGLMEADIVCKSITDAIDLILKPKRLIATLRG